MTSMPAWFDQLSWRNPPVPVIHFVTSIVDRSIIAAGAGVYVFTSDDQALSPTNVKYVGKADGAKQTLRSRLSVYFRRFAKPNGKPTKHQGLEALLALYVANPNALFVRWAGCVVAREIEGSLIALFDPECNFKDEHRLGYDDDELIPADYLYDA